MIKTKARTYQDDALRKAKRQAAKLHKELGVWVTPVIWFRAIAKSRSAAATASGSCRVEHLVDWIRRQRNPRPSFERLALYADST